MNTIASRVKQRRQGKEEMITVSQDTWNQTWHDHEAARAIWFSWGTMGSRVKIRHASPGTLRLLENWVAQQLNKA